MPGMKYEGYALLGTGSLFIPYTTCDVDENSDINVVDDVINSLGWTVNYTLGPLTYGGSLSTPACHALLNNATFRNWIVTDPQTPQKLVVDNGRSRYTYDEMLISRFGINVSEGTVVTMSMSVEGKGSSIAPYNRTEEDHVALNSSQILGGGAPNGYPSYDPIPWYSTVLDIIASDWPIPGGGIYTFDTGDVISWDLNITYNIISINPADGNRAPRYIQSSTMTVEGSVTLYNPGGVGKPPQTKTYPGTITMTSNLGESAKFTLPSIVFKDYSDMGGGRQDKTTRTLNYTGLGTNANAPIYVA